MKIIAGAETRYRNLLVKHCVYDDGAMNIEIELATGRYKGQVYTPEAILEDYGELEEVPWNDLVRAYPSIEKDVQHIANQFTAEGLY
jgi:hypothetical protein